MAKCIPYMGTAPEYHLSTNFIFYPKCTSFGLKDGNLDNFSVLWNLDKIFGMLEELIDITKLLGIF